MKTKRYLIEQPSYHLYIEYVEINNIPVIGIKRTHEGIDLNELERIFAQKKLNSFIQSKISSSTWNFVF